MKKSTKKPAAKKLSRKAPRAKRLPGPPAKARKLAAGALGLRGDGKPAGAAKPRDPRLPQPGTCIQRAYKGKVYELKILDAGCELAGVAYRSLTAAAKTLVGCEVNGFLFWGLVKRSAKPAPAKIDSRKVMPGLSAALGK